MTTETTLPLALPLRVDADGHHAVIVDGSGDQLFSNNDEFLGMGGTPQKAAEIVRRANLHDELVEALRNLLNPKTPRYIGEQPELVGLMAYRIDVEVARAVLAKVEGR